MNIFKTARKRLCSVRDHAKDRFPEFDETEHQVLVNGVEVERLETPIGPMDVIRIKKRRRRGQKSEEDPQIQERQGKAL